MRPLKTRSSLGEGDYHWIGIGVEARARVSSATLTCADFAIFLSPSFSDFFSSDFYFALQNAVAATFFRVGRYCRAVLSSHRGVTKAKANKRNCSGWWDGFRGVRLRERAAGARKSSPENASSAGASSAWLGITNLQAALVVANNKAPTIDCPR